MRRLVLLSLALAIVLPGVARAQFEYAAFGDSITFGVADDNPNETGYPTRLQTMLRQAGQEGATVSNYGISGEETAFGLSRIGGVLDTNPDFILIMEGTNDVFKEYSTETVAFNLEQMVIKAEEQNVIPILGTIIPLRPNAFVTGDLALAKELRQIAVTRSVELSDHYEHFSLYPNGFPELYNLEDPNDDRGHPNGAGFDVMAQAWFDTLMDVDSLPPVLGDVQPQPGAESVSPTVTVSVVLFDHGAGIDNSTVRLLINGTSVTYERTGSATKSTFTYQPAQPFKGIVTVDIEARDQATPSNSTVLRATTFSIQGTVFLNGDINRDGRVDGYDLIEMAFSFGKTTSSSRYRAKNDLNNDNSVDGKDLAILAKNFGKSS
jgi:lysophospholipase L1-like esterase